MIQTYNDILQEIQYFQAIFNGSSQIQKIYSSSYYISIQVRLPGRNHFLMLGRGHGHEGIWNNEKQIISFLRKRDRFLEYLRKFLSASILCNIEIDEKDRIFKLDYRRFGQKHTMMFFYCGRELYFANRFFNEKKISRELFCSWKGTSEDTFTGNDFEIFDEIGRKDIENKESKSESRRFSLLIKVEQKKAESTAIGGKSLKFLKRKEKKILQDISNTNMIDKLQVFANLEDLSKSPMKNKFEGVKLNFKTKEHFKRRDEVYTKIKKLKKAKSILALRLEDTQQKIIEHGEKKNLQNTLKTTAPLWMNKTKSVTKVENKQEYKVLLGELCDIGIGITARGNDSLRKDWAKKSDIWFHLDGDKSPHIVVKLKGAILDEKVFQIISACMKKFGKINGDEVTLIYTPVKNLKGVKGAAGKVIFKKEKRIRVHIHEEFDSIFNINN